MVIVGKHVSIINNTSRRAKVSSSTLNYESLRSIPTAYTTIRYGYLYSRDTYLLIVRKTLSTLAMDDNLIQPFIKRD